MILSVMFDALEIRRENRDHAKANAAQAAQLLEADRRDTLRDDLLRRRREAQETLDFIDAQLAELDYQRLIRRIK
jgi:hypothetical protein